MLIDRCDAQSSAHTTFFWERYGCEEPLLVQSNRFPVYDYYMYMCFQGFVRMIGSKDRQIQCRVRRGRRSQKTSRNRETVPETFLVPLAPWGSTGGACATGDLKFAKHDSYPSEGDCRHNSAKARPRITLQGRSRVRPQAELNCAHTFRLRSVDYGNSV